MCFSTMCLLPNHYFEPSANHYNPVTAAPICACYLLRYTLVIFICQNNGTEIHTRARIAHLSALECLWIWRGTIQSTRDVPCWDILAFDALVLKKSFLKYLFIYWAISVLLKITRICWWHRTLGMRTRNVLKIPVNINICIIQIYFIHLWMKTLIFYVFKYLCVSIYHLYIIVYYP